MGEKRIFFDELQRTGQACGPLPGIAVTADTNQVEENFQIHLSYLHAEAYDDSARLTMMGVQVLDLPTEERDKLNILFFRAEMAIHKGDRGLAENCMRKHLDWKTAGQIAESVTPGLMRRTMNWLRMEKKVDAFQRSLIGGWLLYFLGKFGTVLFLYLDLIRDVLLFWALLALITTGSWLDFAFFFEFSHQVLWLLFFSIVAPLLYTAYKAGMEPSILGGYHKTSPPNCKTWIALPLAIAFFPAIPGLITNVRDIEKEKTKELLKTNEDLPWKLEEAHQRIIFTKRVEKHILSFKEVELVVEVSLQSVIQLMMILIHESETAQATGLDAVFQDNKDPTVYQTEATIVAKAKLAKETMAFLVLSLVLTLKTALSTYIKLNKENKRGYLPTKAKIIIGLRGFIANANGLFSIIIFFSSSLGLFSILHHYKAEEMIFQVPFGTDLNMTIRSLSNDTRSEYSFDEVYRFTNITGTKMPHYSYYTKLSLQVAYIVFLSLLSVQFCAIFITKMFTSESFKKEKLSRKLWHCLRCLLISDALTDWDADVHDTLDDRKKKFEETKWEVTVGCIINGFFNVIRIFPIYVTGIYMRERHALLQDIPEVITYPREVYSKWIILLIEVGYIPLACLLSFVEWGLMRVYQTKCHPWINILTTNEEKAGENDKDGAAGASNVSEGPDVNAEEDVSEGNKGPAIGDSEEEKDSEPTEVEALIETDQNV